MPVVKLIFSLERGRNFHSAGNLLIYQIQKIALIFVHSFLSKTQFPEQVKLLSIGLKDIFKKL